MRYKVILGWHCEFIFDDIDIASNFAMLAMKTICGEVDNDDRIIKIELIPEGGKESE